MNLFLVKTLILPSSLLVLLLQYRINGQIRDKECPSGMCLSKWGSCGIGPKYCGNMTTQRSLNSKKKSGLKSKAPNLRWTPPIAAQHLTKKVVFIIGDGIPADIIEKAMVPNLRKIQEIGQYTRAYVGGDKFTYTETVTLSAPSYMNLLTGTWGNKHNVLNNNVQTPNYHYKNIFRLLKEQQPKKTIAIFSTWTNSRVKLIGERLSRAGTIIFDYKFDGYELNEIIYPHDSEHHYIYNIDQRVTDEASRCIKTQAPDLSWVYLQYTDDIGHRLGDSEQFYQAVNKFDNQIRQIWHAIKHRIKQYKEDWLIIVTTDHGRDTVTGKEHGGQSDRERTTWIVTNSQLTNSYFRNFQPGIVDILPTIARFMNLKIPLESERELDGIPLIGKVSLVKPNASLDGNRLTIKWQVVDHQENVTIWISTTNSFKDGMNDKYNLIETVPIDKQMATIDVTEYPSQFCKIVLEGQHNMVNRWVFRSQNAGVGSCDGFHCGCHKGYCWTYVHEGHAKPGDWWCYTQKAGIHGKEEIWQTCAKDSECSWDRTCGNCRQYKGNEESHQDVCDIGKEKAPAGNCNGSRCGCYKGYCWAYAYGNYVAPGDWWCYTQKAGIRGKKEIWQTCAKDSDCSWNRICGNCRQYKGNEESHRNVC